MKRREFLASAVLVPAVLTTRQEPDEDGLVRLFDGKSLDGWTVRDGPETAFYVNDGAIVVHESAGFPAWLRSAREYENFDFRGEFFVRGWMNSGIYLHAPEHGRNTWCGMKINIFHQVGPDAGARVDGVDLPDGAAVEGQREDRRASGTPSAS